MNRFLIGAVMALAPAGAVSAQEDAGWELRAGLSRAAASVCNADGACFGVVCAAETGWSPGWFAEVEALGDGPVPEPIFAIRTEGVDAARYALTSLGAAGQGDGGMRRYEGAITEDHGALLDALQAGEGVTIDPGRDFALAGFSLRGSRWAVTEAMELCDAGGPDVVNAAPAEDTDEE